MTQANGNSPSREAMLSFLQGEPVPIKHRVGREAEAALAKGVKEIRSKAQANFEERGLETLYCAMVMSS